MMRSVLLPQVSRRISRGGLGFCFALAIASRNGSAQRPDTLRIRVEADPSWGPSVGLEREISIDASRGSQYTFDAVGKVASLGNGAFFVFDYRDTVIRRYDATGKHLGNIGRGGDGPQEFRFVEGMETIGDSLLVVWDLENGRVSLFRTGTGELYRAFKPKLVGRIFENDNFRVDSHGLISILIPDFKSRQEGKAGSRMWVRFSSDGTVVDTIPAEPDSAAKRGFVVLTPDGARESFSEHVWTRASPTGGSVTLRSTPYRISITDAQGRVTIIDRGRPSVRVVDEEWAEWTTLAKGLMGPRGPTLPPNYSVPRSKPAIRNFVIDPLGRIWAELHGPAEKQVLPTGTKSRLGLTWYDRTTYDVFERTGIYLGRVELPRRSELVSIQLDRLWLLVRGPNDGVALEVHRIVAR